MYLVLELNNFSQVDIYDIFVPSLHLNFHSVKGFITFCNNAKFGTHDTLKL